MIGRLLSLVPLWVRGLVLAGLLAAAWLWHTYKVNEFGAQEYARAKAEQAAVDAAKSIENAATSIRKAERNMEIADEQTRLQTERDAARTALAAERAGLRDDTRAFVQRSSCADSTPDGRPDAAAILGELFNQCTERYSAVADAADGLKDQVTGLQTYVQDVVQPGGP